MLSAAHIAVRITTLLAACLASWQPVLALHCTCQCGCCTRASKDTAPKDAADCRRDERCPAGAPRKVKCRCCQASKKASPRGQPQVSVLGFSPCQCPLTCPCREQHRPDPQAAQPACQVGHLSCPSAPVKGTLPAPSPAATRYFAADLLRENWQNCQLCISLCRLTI
jgi:hypothetical protein